ASNRPRRRACLHNGVATPARQLGPHGANDLKAGRNEFEGFADIFTQELERTAACRAVTRIIRSKHMLFARQEFGQAVTPRVPSLFLGYWLVGIGDMGWRFYHGHVTKKQRQLSQQ